MQDTEDGNVRLWGEEAEGEETGPQGHWIILKNGEDENGNPTFLMTTERWSNWHMYSQNTEDGNVRGWEEDPGPQGHFIFTQIE
jgi:hypothetical protein